MTQVVIRGGEQTYVVDVPGNETVGDLKAKVAERQGIDPNLLKIFSNGTQQINEVVVQELKQKILELISLELPGGKVHGSLARAGKVKGQTPKVEKQDKKKKKTGRAKRRIQYNRRFVNVVQGYGRRRGPNANS